MNCRHHRKEQGYSLLETIVSLSVFLLVLFAVYVVLESTQSTYVKGEGKVDVQQRARAAMDQISTLLRNAGYFPENFDANPANGPVGSRWAVSLPIGVLHPWQGIIGSMTICHGPASFRLRFSLLILGIHIAPRTSSGGVQ